MVELSKEQKAIIELVSIGKSNKEISVILGWSIRTISRRVNELFKLYKVHNRTVLAQEYLRERL